MDYYNQIKNELIDNEINKRVKDYSKNRYELKKYFNVGKLLFDAGKHYGEGIIKDYSKRLTSELGKGYTFTDLTRMKKYYKLIIKLATVSQLLSYSHYRELLPIKDIHKIKYYIKVTEEQNLSVRKLREKIKSKEYERLSDEVKDKLENNKDIELGELVPDPILIKSNGLDKNNIKEKALQKLILENIDDFLKQLGDGFCYIGSEYPVKLDRFYYIDLLFFNYIYNCFVVIELKVNELKKEDIGQINFYVNYIDKNIKSINQENTIGIILVKKNNKFILEYSTDRRIYAKTYELV